MWGPRNGTWLVIVASYSPENAMHPPAVVYLHRSNQVSYPRGCYTKRDSLKDFHS